MSQHRALRHGRTSALQKTESCRLSRNKNAICPYPFCTGYQAGFGPGRRALGSVLAEARLAKTVYKICDAGLWRDAERAGVFDGAPVDLTDGYIHFSTAQ